MSWLHRHQWAEAGRRFNPPTSRVTEFKRVGHDGQQLLMQMMYGITVVELRCSSCGDVKAVSYAGDSGAWQGQPDVREAAS